MNSLEKLAKEKYSGDLREAWKYVLYECSPEERDMYTKYVSKEQLDIGMSVLKKKGENEIDQLAKEKFNGDIQKTWDYIFSNCTSEEIDRYVAMADPYQAGQAVVLVNSIKDKTVNKSYKLQNDLSTLKLSREEVLNAKKNPYKVDVMKNLFKIFLTSSSIVALSAIGTPVLGLGAGSLAAVESFLGLVNTSFAFNLAEKLPKYFKFKKAKKELEKNNNNNYNDSMKRGM